MQISLNKPKQNVLDFEDIQSKINIIEGKDKQTEPKTVETLLKIDDKVNSKKEEENQTAKNVDQII